MLRTCFNAQGTNGEDREGQRRQSEGCLGLRCCALGGIPPRSLHCRDPFPGRPTQYVLTDESPRKGSSAPWENLPSEGSKRPRHPLSSSSTAQRRDRDGVVVTDGGTSGTPARFSRVSGWVCWAGKAAAWDRAHPRRRPGHKRGRGRRVKRRSIVAFRVLRAWGHPVPLSAGECALFGQAHAKHAHRCIPPERAQCHASQGPKHPPGFPCQEGDIGGWTQGLAMPPQPSPCCLPPHTHRSHCP